MLSALLRSLASLRLTVVLLSLAVVLVFAGTCAQVDVGIWQVQKHYFHSIVTTLFFQDLVPRFSATPRYVPGGIPFPGGYTIGALVLINLLAAHVRRFGFSRKRIGIILIHFGLVLLLLGELFTSLMAREGRMILDEGASSSYVEDSRRVELAVIDPSPRDHDRVTVIPGSRMQRGEQISDPALPFTIAVDEFYPNSAILGPMQAGALKDARATAGSGVGITVVPKPRASGTAGGEVDVPSAYVTLQHGDRPLGRWLVTAFMDEPQKVQIDGRAYLLQLRFARSYLPFTLHLLDFKHDRYPGTEIPRNFSSDVRLVDSVNGEDRQVTIRMNEPLRHGGLTFYQASFLPGDRTSILQVVRNPAWLMPYIACVIGTVGLLIHFGTSLLSFLKKRSASLKVAKPSARGSRTGWLIPGTVAAAAALWLVSMLFRPGPLNDFGTLPVSYEGRIQPLDSVARNALRTLSGRQTISLDGQRLSAIEWFHVVQINPQQADKLPVFRIDHPEVLSLARLDAQRKRFSYEELVRSADMLQRELDRASQLPATSRTLFDRKLLELGGKLRIYQDLAMENLRLAPAAGQWLTPIEVARSHEQSGQRHAVLDEILLARQSSGEARAAHLAAAQAQLDEQLPQVMRKVRFESLYNRVDPLYVCAVLYVGVFLLAAFSWLGLTRPLARSAGLLLALTLVVHSLALAARVYISGRPPVTNLASSAIFIAWGAVILAALLERVYRNGIGSAVGAAIGFTSLVIYMNLAQDGDTMKVLQAVLDTNFWLATHVVSITLGYSAMFLAGALGMVYILGGLYTRRLQGPAEPNLHRMIYGTVCFGLLFSFVGTILGGIWADQSWGRFWGWDPKENGAVLIVLWSALILHARWGRLIQGRGVAVLAVGGNIVTSWSWFGTNMLGVGLHSYGFMDQGLYWLLIFDLSQLLVIALGSLPVSIWRSQINSGAGTTAPANCTAQNATYNTV